MNHSINYTTGISREMNLIQPRDPRLMRDLPSSLMVNIFEYAGPVSVIIVNDHALLMRTLLLKNMTGENIRMLSQIKDDFLNHQPKESELKLLAASNNTKARVAVALNVITPLNLLANLATDSDTTVRLAVALNSKAPLAVLRMLRDDSNIEIQFVSRMAISLHLDATGASHNEWPNQKIRSTIVKNDNCPSVVLDLLASDSSNAIRLAIAQHRNTLPRTLAKLSSDADKGVRSAAVVNPNNI
jgi:hypothetical protein